MSTMCSSSDHECECHAYLKGPYGQCDECFEKYGPDKYPKKKTKSLVSIKSVVYTSQSIDNTSDKDKCECRYDDWVTCDYCCDSDEADNKK